MSTTTLPNIRVSSDLTVRVRLKDGGVYIDWSTLNNIKAHIYSDAQRALAGRCDVSVDAEDSTLLVCNYAANKPQYVGVNRIVVSAKYMGETKTYDKPAFNFVRWTADQEGEEITIDDPDVDVEIEVEDVTSSILQEAIDAALQAAADAEHAAHLVPLEVLQDCEQATADALEAAATANAAGIDEVQATVDAQVGTPSVDVDLENKVLSLDFHNMKGETGEAAGFGTASASLTEDGGDPGVTVSASGPDTAKQFAFTFKNLKGDKGDKGDQGNTGSSVEYPYELVNNLTTNDATKGLTAAMGVTLEGEVSQLEAKVDGFEFGKINEGILSAKVIENSYVRNDTGVFVPYSGWSRTDYLNVALFSSVIITATVASIYNAFYDKNKEYVSGFSLVVGENKVAIPEGACYLVISNTTAGTLATAFAVGGYKTDSVQGLEQDVNEIGLEIGKDISIRHENSAGQNYVLNLKAGQTYIVTTTRGVGYATRNVVGGVTIQSGFFYEGVDNIFEVTEDAVYLGLGTFTVVDYVDVTLTLKDSIKERLKEVEGKADFAFDETKKTLEANNETTFRYGAVYTNGNIAEGWPSHDRAITELLNINGDVSVELLNATSTIVFAVCGKYIGSTFVGLTDQLYFTNNKCDIPYNGEYDRLVLTIKPQTGTISEEELRVMRLKSEYLSGSLANSNELKKVKDYRYNLGFDFDLTRIPTPTMYSGNVIRSNDLDEYNGYWESLRLQYPQYITKIDSSTTDAQFGITRPAYLENMPIYLYKFIPSQKSGQTTLNSDTIKVMLVLGTHSQERGGMFACLQLMQYICEGWKNDRNVMMMRTSVEFYIVTCLNPWGYANTGVVPYAGRINYNEVNLNRNFPTPNWRSDESSKAYYNYEGESPASEYETKTMMAFYEIVKPDIFIDVHTSGSLNTGEIGTFEFYPDAIKNELFTIANDFTARVSADNRDYPDNPDNHLIKIVKVPDSPAEGGEHGTLAYYFGYNNPDTISTLIECMGEQSYWSNGVYDTTQPAQGHTAKLMRECLQWQWCILQRLIDAYSKKIE